MISALTTTAEAQRAEIPPFLHARIRAHLDTPSLEASRPIMGLPWKRALLVPTCGVLLLAAYWVRKPEPQKLLSHSMVAAPERRAVQPSMQPLAPGKLAAELPFLASLPQSDWVEKLDQPLETEMHFVVSDAKTALYSLAANFLPEREF